MDFDTFILSRTTATLPFVASDSCPVVRGGVTFQVPALAFPGAGNWTLSLGLNANSTNPAAPLSLTAQFNEITQSIGGAYVQLNQTLTQLIIVANYGGADILIIPAAGSQINNLGANNPYTLLSGSSQLFFPAYTVNKFYSLIP